MFLPLHNHLCQQSRRGLCLDTYQWPSAEILIASLIQLNYIITYLQIRHYFFFFQQNKKKMIIFLSSSSAAAAADFWLTCRYRGQHAHQWAPFQVAGRSPGMSIMRGDSRELPLSVMPLCQPLPCHLGPSWPTFSINIMSKAVLTAPLEHSTCPYQRSLLSFRIRSRSSKHTMWLLIRHALPKHF